MFLVTARRRLGCFQVSISTFFKLLTKQAFTSDIFQASWSIALLYLYNQAADPIPEA
jgi:hypothetical protein